MKKYLLALTTILYCVHTQAVENKDFSLSSHIKKLVEQHVANTDNTASFKKFLITQLEICKEQPDLLFRLHSQTIKNYGPFFKDLQTITDENSKYYIVEKQKQALIRQEWINKHEASPKKEKLSDLKGLNPNDQAMKNAAALQVISMLLHSLTK